MEELELVRGLRERREEVVAIFLERYRSLFYHCISHFEPDASSRDDLYQDVILYVLHRLDADSFDPEKGSLGTWLYRVAWCRCVDLKRQQNARRRIRLTTQGDDLPERADPTESLPERLAGAEIGSAVRRAMADLPDEERALLVLRFVEQRTLLDIAAALGITLEQAKYRLKRASVALRRELLSRLPKSEVAG